MVGVNLPPLAAWDDAPRASQKLEVFAYDDPERLSRAARRDPDEASRKLANVSVVIPSGSDPGSFVIDGKDIADNVLSFRVDWTSDERRARVHVEIMPDSLDIQAADADVRQWVERQRGRRPL
jgi:hypothetical protein